MSAPLKQTELSPLAGERGVRAAALLVRTPRSLRILGRLLALTVALTGGGLVLIPWQQSVSGTGRVVAFAPLERQQEIDAPIEGRVTKWNVREGSRVKPGDLLLELTDNDPSILMRLGEERAAVVARRAATIARVTSIVARQRSLESSRVAGIRRQESSNRIQGCRKCQALGRVNA